MAPRDANAQERAIVALRDAVLAAENFRQVSARGLGLGVTETQAISHLVRAGTMGQTELAAALGITTSSVTSLVDRMERGGLVKRLPHPHDRRRTEVTLTKFGEQAVQRANDWFLKAFDSIGRDDLDAVSEMLHGVAEGLRAAAGNVP